MRTSKLGPNQMPIGFTRDGTPVEILPAQTLTGPLRLRNAAGELVEVTKASRDSNGELRLLDASGAVVQPRLRQIARPTLARAAAEPAAASSAPVANELALAHKADALGHTIRVQKFILGGSPIFIDLFGNVVDVDQDQADGSVLMARNNSLVYFTIMVNDVWAYFMTGVKDGAIPGQRTQFPLPGVAERSQRDHDLCKRARKNLCGPGRARGGGEIVLG